MMVIIDGGEDSTKKEKDGIDELILQDSLNALNKKIQVAFKLKKVEQSADSVYFNVVTFTNTDSKTISGALQVRVPNDWKLIADPSMDNIELAPNETISLPVRVSIPLNSTGGVAYVIDASFTTQNGIYSGAAYVKIPMKSKWDAEVFEKQVYFNELFDRVPFKLKIVNEGNATELLKVNLDVGRLYNIIELDKEEFYVEVPPLSDTIIEYTVESNDLLTIEQRTEYGMIWDESSVKVKIVGSDGKKFQDAVHYLDLENELTTQRQEKNTPLNVDFSIFNLLSPNPTFVNLLVYGQLLFKGDHDLSYMGNFRNIYRNGQFFGPTFWSNPNNIRYQLGYSWKDRLHVNAGLITNYTLHTGRGIGARASYDITEKDRVQASFVSNQFLPIIIGTAEYHRRLKTGINLNIGLTYEDNDYVNYQAYSTQLGGSFVFAGSQSISGQVLLTNARFDATAFGGSSDSSLVGASYNFKYSGAFIDNKLRVSLSTRNDQFNFLRLRPVHVISGNSLYRINKVSNVKVFGIYNAVKPSRYTLSPFYNGLYAETQVYRATYQYRFNDKVTSEAGPMAKILSRRSFDNSLGLYDDFDNYFIGGYFNTRFRLNERTFISPTLTIGRTSFRNILSDSTILSPILSTSVGANITGRNFRFNASYIRGPMFFVDDDYILFDEISMETVSLRGQMDKFIYKNTIKLSGFANYYLRLPSNRQSIVLSGRTDFFFPEGWRAYLTAGIFTNSYVDESTQGISASRFFNLNVGVIKSFGFNQPRIKYSDVEFVCFNDFNGDGERQENEPLLPNIKVKLSLDPNYDDPRGIKWGERELMTSAEGKVVVHNMPDINYLVNFKPMVNLGTLYNVNGDNQIISVNEDRVIYVPYAESYRVYGNVVMNRDEYSSKGLINVGGIRITATNLKGDAYSVLTDNDGSYVLNVPQAGSYVISVNNIFGDQFYIDKESFVIQFDGFKTYQLDFTFYEGKRKVNFGGDNIFNFQSLNGSGDDNNSDQEGANGAGENTSNADSTDTGNNAAPNGDFMQNAQKLREEIEKISKENEKTIETPVNPDDVRYMVEIGVFDDEIDTDVANLILSLGFTPTAIKVDGVTVYATPVKKTHAEINEVLQSIYDAGLSEAMIVGIYQGKIITEDKAREFRGE
ncbi:COG1470 family protein [Parvicella tangerina]|nr:hypothetical protein [Parvicella tangerina]